MNRRVFLQQITFWTVALTLEIHLFRAVEVWGNQMTLPELEKIKAQYIKYIIGSPNEKTIINFQRQLNKDGTWPDIKYNDDKRSDWEPSKHVVRIAEMAKAYCKPGHPLFKNKDLHFSILLALNHYLSKNYKCKNWWYNRIGVPRSMADILILMGNAIPKETSALALKKIVSQAKIGMTGQNKVWLSEILLVRSLVENKPELTKRSLRSILSELRVTTQEGIQPDWSYHQHGPQLQLGNYGAAFAASLLKWATIFHKTPFSLDNQQLDILRNFILEGTNWVVWKGRQDLNGCGRQVRKNCQKIKGRAALRQVQKLLVIDPRNQSIYSERLASNEDKATNTFVGNKHFWRSDIMIHRRPMWYASVKMSSERVIGAEAVNFENMLGRHLGDGVLFVHLTGDEYKNIQPVWDWHRPPGTTTDQSNTNLIPNKKLCRPPVSYVGGVSNGTSGFAVYEVKSDTLVGRKAWFFEGDRIICLGTGISSTSGGQILTSIQQALLEGPVVGQAGNLAKGKYTLNVGTWIHHSKIGYHLIDSDHAVLQIDGQTGNWHRIFTKQGSQTPITRDVFSLWLDHGQKPKEQKYAYVIYPDINVSDMDITCQSSNLKILSNSTKLQAISLDNMKLVRAAFYQAGTLTYAGNKELKVESPCLISLDWSRKQLFIADPTQTLEQVNLSLNGQPLNIALPKAGDRGKSVSQKV